MNGRLTSTSRGQIHSPRNNFAAALPAVDLARRERVPCEEHGPGCSGGIGAILRAAEDDPGVAGIKGFLVFPGGLIKSGVIGAFDASVESRPAYVVTVTRDRRGALVVVCRGWVRRLIARHRRVPICAGESPSERFVGACGQALICVSDDMCE